MHGVQKGLRKNPKDCKCCMVCGELCAALHQSGRCVLVPVLGCARLVTHTGRPCLGSKSARLRSIKALSKELCVQVGAAGKVCEGKLKSELFFL